MAESKVLKRIFGSKKEDLAQKWKEITFHQRLWS